MSHLHRMLGRANSSPPALLVVSLSSEWPAALAVAGLARELAEAGQNVLVADYTAGGAARGQSKPAPKAGQGTIRVVAGGANAAAGTGDADAVIVLAALDPELGAFHLRALASTAVAVVAMGRATPTALYGAAQMLRAAGIDLVASVLVGADRADETLGIPGGRWESSPPPPSTGPAPNGGGAVTDAPSVARAAGKGP